MRPFLRWSSFFDQYLGSAAITIPSPTWACFWQLIFNFLLPLDCIRERWPGNKGEVHKLLWIEWLGPLWPTGFGSILLQLKISYFRASCTNNHFRKKNEPGTSSAAMFSHYTAIKIKNKCYQFFFSKSFKCSLCLFLLNSVLISQKQCTGFFFHSSSALNNKDLIILTFITIAG